MAGGQALTPSCFTTLNQPDAYNSPTFALVPVRKAADTMSIAAHHSNYQLAIWQWPDTDAQPVRYLVTEALTAAEADIRPITRSRVPAPAPPARRPTGAGTRATGS